MRLAYGCRTLSGLLLLLLLSTAAATTVYVSNSSTSSNTTSFIDALKDPAVTNIVLKDDYYSVEHSFAPHMPGGGSGAINVTRNITVTSVLGIDTILDLAYAHSAVELCNTCTILFENMTIAGDRRSPGAEVDLFLGHPGSKYFPDPDGQQTMEIVNSTSFRGNTYIDQLYITELSFDQPRIVQEGRGAVGGVAARALNLTRICRASIDEACLKDRSADACVNMLVDKLLAEDAAAAAAGGAGKGSNPAAIAAGAAVAGAVLVAAVVALMLWLRSYKRRSSQQELLPVKAEQSSSRPARRTGLDGGSKASSYNRSGVQKTRKSSTYNKPQGPEGEGKVWERSWTLTTPLVPEDQRSAPIELGELLGSGSFGHVYKGTWAGRDVAVKIIAHDTANSDAVENEVTLMVGFNHPNIVRAYHSITYTNSAHHSRMHSTHSMHSADAAAAAPAADQDSFSTSSTSAQARHELASGSFLAHVTPHGALPVLHTFSESPHAAPDAPPGRSDAAVTSRSNQQMSAAGARLLQPSDSKTATQDSTWDAAAVDGATDAYDTTCSTYLGSAGMQTSGMQHRAETWIVLEYCDMGTLDSALSSWEGDEESDSRMLQRLLLLKDVASGLQVLHASSVVHGDLNSRNVLVASSAAAECGMVAKVADLGLSRAVKQNKTHRTTDTIGTMSHMPPELLRYGRMSTAGDIYAFGISMWELYTGTPAFKKLHYGQFFEYICLRNLRPLIPAEVPKDYAILMESCWATDPANRPKAERIVECLRYMIIERHNNLAAAAAAAAADSAAAAAPIAPNTPAIGGVQQATLLKMSSLLRRAADSPDRTAVTAAGGAANGASAAADGTLQRGGSQDAAASVAGSSGQSLAGNRRVESGSSWGRSTPSTTLGVDIYGGYTALSNPTGLMRAFSMASKGSAGDEGVGYVSTPAQEAAAGDDGNKEVEQPRLLLPQNSIQDGMRWFL